MSTAVDPREVLKIVNNFGYKNISPKELKEFTKDLKKLIKYETQSRHVNNIASNTVTVNSYFPEQINDHKLQSTLAPATLPKPDSPARRVTPVKKKHQKESRSKELLTLPKHVKTKSSNIVYKTGNRHSNSNASDGVLVRNTPTDLYQKYQNDWNKFKKFIPGENSRIETRKSIRQKLQQKPETESKVYVYFPNERKETF